MPYSKLSSSERFAPQLTTQSQLIRHRPLKLALTPLFVVSIAIAFIGSVGNSICGFYYYMNKPEQLGGFQIKYGLPSREQETC